MFVSNEQLIRSYVEAWNSQDIDRLKNMFLDDATYSAIENQNLANNDDKQPDKSDEMTDKQQSEKKTATQAIADMWHQISDRYADVRMEIASIIPDDNKPTLEWRLSGTEKTGDKKPWQLSGSDTFEFRDERIHSLKSSLNQWRSDQSEESLVTNTDQSGQGNQSDRGDSNQSDKGHSSQQWSDQTPSDQSLTTDDRLLSSQNLPKGGR